MDTLAEKAVTNHKNGDSCSAAVLRAFAEMTGLSDSDVDCVAGPYAGGKMGKCGAVLAAEYVLRQVCGADRVKIEEYELRFIARGKGSVLCRELRGKVPGSCRACVSDAAQILVKMISQCAIRRQPE